MKGGWQGGGIIFASDRLDSDDLWRIAPDGSSLTRITTHSGLLWYLEPSWSPDGQWIVFEARRPGDSEDGSVGQIWKVRADGTELTPLTDGTHDDRQPNWSPSGERILFQRRSLPNGDWDIYTISPDGSNLYNVTSSPSSDTDASWSPDGSWIVYSSDYGGLPAPNIYAIHASGGVPARVTSNATHEDGAPSWSPDGQWIAFESHAGQDEDSPAALRRIADVRTLPELDALTDEFANCFGAAAGSESGRERLANVTHWLYLIGDNPEPDGGRVKSVSIERAAKMTPWDQPGSVRRFQKLMERLGVDKALHEAGAQEGDTVYIGEYELEYQD